MFITRRHTIAGMVACFFAGAVLCTPFPASADATLATLHTTYTHALARIDTEYQTSLDSLAKKYVDTLRQAGNREAQRGNPEAVQSIRNELDRFAAQQVVPDAAMDPDIETLRNVEISWQKLFASCLTKRSREIVLLVRQYQFALLHAEEQLTAKGQQKEASAFKQEREMVVLRPSYVLATNSLARLQAISALPSVSGTNIDPDRLAEDAGDLLILHYAFDSEDVARATDSSGNGHEGSMYKTKWVKNGKQGGALEFEERAHLDAGTVKDLNRVRDFTVMLWARTEPSKQANVFMAKEEERQSGWILFANNGKLLFWSTRDHADIQADDPFKDKRWHHLAVVVAEKHIVLYVDGQPVGRAETALVANDLPLYVGARHHGAIAVPSFLGTMDEIMVVSRAMSKGEVEQFYKSQAK